MEAIHSRYKIEEVDHFSESNMIFSGIIKLLQSRKCRAISTQGRELLRKLLEEHLELRGIGDIGNSVEGDDDVVRGEKRTANKNITTTFGKVQNNRLSYSHDGVDSLFPKDTQLNLPDKSYSHSLTKELALTTACLRWPE